MVTTENPNLMIVTKNQKNWISYSVSITFLKKAIIKVQGLQNRM